MKGAAPARRHRHRRRGHRWRRPETLNAEEIAKSVRHIAIAGNPNCGKSTIFNALTGLRQRVGNYSGVTVEHKVGRFYGSHGEPMSLVDLPGHYSLQVRSPDEAVARDVLLGRRSEEPRPDTVVAVVDASNLERNLYLLAQVLDLGLPTVVALNMVDMAEKNGIRLDIPALAEELGVPVIPVVATRGSGLMELKQALSKPLPLPAKRPPMPPAFEREAQALAKRLTVSGDVAFPEAVLLLTLNDDALDDLAEHKPEVVEAVLAAQARLREAGLDPLCSLVEARYQWIDRICGCVMRQAETGLSFSDRLDRVLTHRVWGLVVFLAAMAFMFFCIFSLGQVPMDWIDEAAQWAGRWVTENLPPGNFRDLLANGAIPGVSGVTIFLPQILILYFFLGMLEDSGYMARAAFMMDRIMSAVGLHGKSFIPLLSSFGCAVPGIMAARTVENRKDRLVTILISPLMTCPARLPVYTLMIGILLPGATSLAKAGILLSLYLGGIIVAGILAWIFKKTLLKTEKSMLLLELPPYRMPSLRSTALRMGERAWTFLKRAGTVILALSILLWALVSFPKPPAGAEVSKADAIAQSYAGRMGHWIEPAIRPLGYDWKIGIGLVSSFAAREVFVGTMAIVYNVEGEEDNNLRETLSAEVRPDGTPVFTPMVCVSLLVFYMLAMQCISTIVVVRRETNSWRWPLMQLTLMTGLAWSAAFAVYHGGRLLGYH